MKRSKDSPKININSSDRKDRKKGNASTSSVSKKPMFDTNYYYYFTEVQQKK